MHTGCGCIRNIIHQAPLFYLADEFFTTSKSGPPVAEKLANIVINELLPDRLSKVNFEELMQETRTTDSSMQTCQELFNYSARIEACTSQYHTDTCFDFSTVGQPRINTSDEVNYCDLTSIYNMLHSVI